MGKNSKKTLGDLKNDGLNLIKTDDMTKLVGGNALGKIRWKGGCGGIVPQ
ncbi:MAG: hypothetical protein AAFV95_22490 [Bacteroidota bacterium]